MSNFLFLQVEEESGGGDAENSGESSREEEDESSLKDTLFFSIFQNSNHPCNYFGLAKQAFFKCFGLDSSSRSREHEKRDWLEFGMTAYSSLQTNANKEIIQDQCKEREW